MLNLFKKIITIIFLTFLFFPTISYTNENQESADFSDPTTQGPNLGDAFGSNLEDVASESGYKVDIEEESVLINRVLSAIINTVLSVMGLIFVILTILAGFKWMTAGGNQEQVNKAKTSLKQNIIGLVIVVASWGIWALVLQIISEF